MYDVNTMINGKFSGALGSEKDDFENAIDWSAYEEYADVISISHGWKTSDDGVEANGEGELTHFVDAIADNLDVLIVLAAGNEGSGSETLRHPADAYNCMTVANMDDQGSITRTGDTIATSSSRGPTADGRKKPDIAAPGTNIMSTNAYWEGQADFVSYSGTSMATPHISAAAAWFMDYGLTALETKALLINTADDWGTTGWDDTYGWGYVQLWRAHSHMDDTRYEDEFEDDVPIFYQIDDSEEGGKATLVWRRHIGYDEGENNYTDVYDLENIDLYLYDESDGSEGDSSDEDKENVQQVVSDDNYDSVVIKVKADDTWGGYENFAIATEEDADYTITPPTISASISNPSTKQIGQLFNITAQVTPTGDLNAHSVSVTVNLPSGLTIISGSNPQSLGTIIDGSPETAIWTVNSSQEGIKNFDVDVTSSSYDEIYDASDSSSIDITSPDTTPPSITILSPTNNTEYSTSSVDLNWSANETLSWCAYRLDNGANDTSICEPEWSYQENADSSHCAETWDSTYTCGNVYDGNWNTYGFGALIGYLYINYTKPLSAQPSSLWQIKNNSGAFNLTIGSNCWNQGIMQFKIQSRGTTPPFGNLFLCWDGSNWTTLGGGGIGGGASSSYVYEDAMWWYLDNPRNKTLMNISNGNHNIIIYGNDTSGNMGQSSYVYFTIGSLKSDGESCTSNGECQSNYCDNDGVGWSDDYKWFSVESTYYDNQDHKCEEKARTANDDWCDEKRNEDLNTCDKTGATYKEDTCSDTCVISDKSIFECTDSGCSCTASECDGLTAGNNISKCTYGATSYFADKCTSTAGGEDRGDNICRSSAFAAGCIASTFCNSKSPGDESTSTDECCYGSCTSLDCDSDDDTSGSDGTLKESEATSSSCTSVCSSYSTCCDQQSITCSANYECDYFHSLITNEDETPNNICYKPNSGAWKFASNAEATESACSDGYDNDCDGDVDSNDSDCGEFSCGDSITENTVLTNDLTNCPSHGLVIGSDGITLDCAGHSIDGDASEPDYGIFLNNSNGITIKNCVLSDFYYGISVPYSNNNNIINNTINNNDNGIILESCNNNSITSNKLSGNDYGIYLISCFNSTITDNDVIGNGAYGAYMK